MTTFTKLKKVRQFLFVFLGFITSTFGYSIDFESIESYELMPVDFKANVDILSETVCINNLKTEIEIELLINPNQNSDNTYISAEIQCIPKGHGRSYTDMLIPKDFEIVSNNKKLEFDVLYNGKKYNSQEAFITEGHQPSNIQFSIEAKKGVSNLKISYYNCSNSMQTRFGYGTTIMNYRYISNRSKKSICFYYDDIKLPGRLSKILSIKDIETNTNDYINNFWQTENESECNIERVVSRNNEIIWKCLVPEATSRLEILLEENYQQIVFYPLGIQFDGITTDKSIINKSKLFFLSKNQLETLRNSFYAIHGYAFKNQKWKDYFYNIFNDNGKKYVVNSNFSESDFNDIEKKNIELIRELENTKEPILLSEYLNK